MDGLIEAYTGKSVLITGGLGFIGSNLALALRRLGASVTVVDAMIEGCGANEHNLDGAAGEIQVVRTNIDDAREMARVLPGTDVIFNLAGEISHSRSLLFPERDLDLNGRANLHFLQHCRNWAPKARVVYASSRQVYGPADYLPVDEKHPIHPVDFNGAHKKVAEFYHQLSAQLYGIETVILRLTNVYGPRQALDLSWQGFIGIFLARSLRGEPIAVYGTGEQLRDMVFVDDVVDAFLCAGTEPLEGGLRDQTFNIGGPEPVALTHIAETVAGIAGAPPNPVSRIVHVPFPESCRRIDIGSYYADYKRFQTWTGWRPRVSLRDGLERTVAFYREHASKYPLGLLDSADRPQPIARRALGAVAL